MNRLARAWATPRSRTGKGVRVPTRHPPRRRARRESLHLAPDHDAIGALPPGEQERVQEMLAGLKAAYQRHCTYLTSDRLRGVLRTYIEDLNAIRVRPTGGVYFVHRRHAGTLAALRELVRRFGARQPLVPRLPPRPGGAAPIA